MSATVEVRLVPALVPAPRRELQPVTVPASSRTLLAPAAPAAATTSPAAPPAGTVPPVTARPSSDEVPGEVADGRPGAGTRGPGAGTGADAPTGEVPETGPDATSSDGVSDGAPVGEAGTAPRTPTGTAPGTAPGSTPVTIGTPADPGGRRTRPVRSRAAHATAIADCLPVPERLGAATLATYRHGPTGGTRDEEDENHSIRRAVRHATALPPALASGAVNPLDPRQACCTIALAAVEVLTGTRPIAQLARWVTPDVYDALARRAALTAPRTRVLDPAASPGDLRDSDPVAWSRRPSVRRVRACPVDENTLEASVVVAHAGRVRAVALRLARDAGRWRASALVVG